MLDICLLGTGGMMPLPYRWLTAMMARCDGSSLLIDCGEGTQIALKEKGWSPKPIDVICFTHYHADHVSGLPGDCLKRNLSFLGNFKKHRNIFCIKRTENIPKIKRKLETLQEVGLGYIKLGQSSTTLSGGEAQRVKLATELSKRSTGKTIYILDEPTTGLHTADVHKLTEVLDKLVEGGNTVVVIEHNLDVIKTADYIIDMGPEGGDNGGTVIASGTPEQVAKVEKSYTGKYLKKMLE